MSFEEAIEVFDEDHSDEDDRYKVIGVLQSRLIIISLIFTERGETVRVISARKANKEERSVYEQKR